jgi:hypothetical protein
MKKKTVKKLALSRETLRGLEEDTMQDVIGASGTGVICGASRCLYASCDSCNTCGTMYC